jgi:hypothetical protein
MSRWKPCKRNDFISRLRQLGFAGLYSGAKHQFMVYENHRLTISSNKEYSVPQLRMMIREVEGLLGVRFPLMNGSLCPKTARLTTHSTGARVSLSFIVNLNGL